MSIILLSGNIFHLYISFPSHLITCSYIKKNASSEVAVHFVRMYPLHISAQVINSPLFTLDTQDLCVFRPPTSTVTLRWLQKKVGQTPTETQTHTHSETGNWTDCEIEVLVVPNFLSKSPRLVHPAGFSQFMASSWWNHATLWLFPWGSMAQNRHEIRLISSWRVIMEISLICREDH